MDGASACLYYTLVGCLSKYPGSTELVNSVSILNSYRERKNKCSVLQLGKGYRGDRYNTSRKTVATSFKSHEICRISTSFVLLHFAFILLL